GMFVEGSKNFDAGWRVMYLVKDQPEFFGVAQAMPPIKEEGANEPADKSLSERRPPLCQREDRGVAKHVKPQAGRRQGDDQLRQIDQDCPDVPALGMG